jgi:hypothetical protein
MKKEKEFKATAVAAVVGSFLLDKGKAAARLWWR